MRFICVASIVASVLLAGPDVRTSAAPINYGDFAGTTVTYVGVTENTLTAGDPSGMFGAPTVTGDSLDFDPVNFFADADGASGVDVTIGTVEFDIAAIGPNVIDLVQLTEAGTTTLAGFGGAGTFSSVTADISVDIEEVDGAPVPGGVINFPTTMTFTPSGGDYDLAADGGGGPVFNTQWNGIALIDIDDILADAGVSGEGATLVTVTLTNTLTALSEDGTRATISKQDFDGISITTNIPEPASLALLVGLGCLTTATRRR